jgi:hypothetical protein
MRHTTTRHRPWEAPRVARKAALALERMGMSLAEVEAEVRNLVRPGKTGIMMHETEITRLLREILDALESFAEHHPDKDRALSVRINKWRVRAHTVLHILDGAHTNRR